MRVRWPGDPLDVALTDIELAAEVDLLSQLMIAANDSEGRLCQAEIDRVLFLLD